jgi:hypothetical protein
LALLFGPERLLDLYEALADSVILANHESSMWQVQYFVKCIIT